LTEFIIFNFLLTLGFHFQLLSMTEEM